jgi:hypothetical protein
MWVAAVPRACHLPLEPIAVMSMFTTGKINTYCQNWWLNARWQRRFAWKATARAIVRLPV